MFCRLANDDAALLDYADRLIRRCFWRGIPVTAEAGARLSVNGWDADDFVQEAVDRLSKKQRAYRPEVGLENLLRGIIRSLVWSSNKSSLREPLLDICLLTKAISRGGGNRHRHRTGSRRQPAFSGASRSSARAAPRL